MFCLLDYFEAMIVSRKRLLLLDKIEAKRRIHGFHSNVVTKRKLRILLESLLEVFGDVRIRRRRRRRRRKKNNNNNNNKNNNNNNNNKNNNKNNNNKNNNNNNKSNDDPENQQRKLYFNPEMLTSDEHFCVGTKLREQN